MRFVLVQDALRIRTLLGKLFRSPPSEAEISWYFESGPMGRSRVYGLEDDTGGLVGCFAFKPMTLRIGGASVQAALGHHLAIDPAFRVSSAYVELSRYALAGEADSGSQFVYGPPNKNAIKAHMVLMKWRVWSPLALLVCNRPPRARENDGFSVERTDAFPVEVCALAEFHSSLFEASLIRTAEWMTWRYLQHPKRPYVCLLIRKHGRLEGCVVAKPWSLGEGKYKVHIMDLLCMTETSAAAAIGAVWKLFPEATEVNTWSTPGHPYDVYLRDSGFVPAEAPQPLIFKSLGDYAPASGRVDFSYGLADGY